MFLENIYKKAVIIELTRSALKVEEEKPLFVYYDDQVVGEFYIDLLVEDTLVVELKSVENIAKQHEVQLVNYLKGTKKEIGLLINFGPTGVQVKRKYLNPKSGCKTVAEGNGIFPVSSGNRKRNIPKIL